VTDGLQFLVAGLSLGSIYALVCLGFVVIYRATGVLNFAQGGLVILGAYLTHQFVVGWNLPFAIGVPGAVLAVALFGRALERFVLRPMVTQPVFATILVTLGVLFVLEQACAAVGLRVLMIGDPWGVGTVDVAGAVLKVADLWTIVAAIGCLGAFFALFRLTTVGIAMRAGASDPEAALAHGISPRAIHGLSWAIAGAVACLAGVLVAAGPKGVDLGVTAVAFRALPAMILGGLESPGRRGRRTADRPHGGGDGRVRDSGRAVAGRQLPRRDALPGHDRHHARAPVRPVRAGRGEARVRLNLRNVRLTTRYEDDLVLWRSRPAQAGALLVFMAFALAPFVVGNYWTTVLVYAGIAAIGSIGLNLLTGFTGQASLGNAFFLGVGAYSGALFADRLGLPFPIWLLAASAVGG
jgi:branched-chain amino acid transport system permease protein